MGETRRQFTDDGHAILLLQLFAHARHFRQISKRSNEPGHVSVGIANTVGGQAQQPRTLRAYLRVKLVAGEIFPQAQGRRHRTFRTRLGHDDTVYMTARHILFHQIQDAAGFLVHGHDQAFGVGDKKAAVHVVQNFALELFHPADALIPVAADKCGKEEGESLNEIVVPVGQLVGCRGCRNKHLVEHVHRGHGRKHEALQEPHEHSRLEDDDDQ